MTKDEALRLALKAMVVNNKAWKHLADSGDSGYWEAEEQGYYQLNEKAIKAVEAALEAKDEPVVFNTLASLKHKKTVGPIESAMSNTTSPQRKPLTDDEIWKFWWARPAVPDGEDDSMEAQFVAAVRAIEAAHGIKEEA
jgi:hypothetical protein